MKSTTRPGFTLLEIMVAMGIGAIVLGLVANAYLGANKAQSVTVATGLMKSSGQTAVNDLYHLLRQAHTLFGRGGTANSFLARLPISGYSAEAGALTPGVNTADVRLPVVTQKPAFWQADASGAANPDFNADNVGNALLFGTSETRLVMTPEFGYTNEFHLTPRRLHFYFLARRPMPANARRIGNAQYTYQLMHWRSALYIDYFEAVTWLNKMKDAGVADTDIDTKLSRLAAATPPIAGLINLSAVDAAMAATPAAIFQLRPTASYRDFERNTTERFKTDNFHTAIKYAMRDSFGETMIAFNTTAPSPSPGVRVAGLDVPAFAPDNSTFPFGFEVMAGGEADHRQVLIRMALAARTQPGSLMIGQTFQQVVHCYADAVNGP